MENIKYGSYTRKSTEDDARQILSIEAQSDAIKKHFGELDIVLEFSESRSAYQTNKRDEFNKLLAALDSGEINGIVAWHPDRLSRNETDAAEITRRFRNGVIKDMKFAAGVSIDNTPESMMMLMMTQAQSQYFSSKLSKDVKRGNDKKRRMGGLTGRAPTGYLNVNSTVVPDPERFHLIRKSFDLYLSGEFSVPTIHKILSDEWGFRTLVRNKSGGGKLALGTLYNIFSNVRYAGLVPDPYETGVFHKANFEAMISPEEYDKVQALLGTNGMPRLTHKNKDFPLRGFIHCGECGCAITAQTKKKVLKDGTVNLHTYYHCTGKRGECSQKAMYIKELDLESQLICLLDSYEISSEMFDWAMESFRQLAHHEIQERNGVQLSHAKAITSLQGQLDRLLNLYTLGHIDDAQFSDKSTSLKDELALLQEDQAETSYRVKNWYEIATTTLEKLTNANEQFTNGTLATKQDILLAIGQNPVLIDKQLRITPNKWLLPVANGAKSIRAEINKVRTEPQQMKKASEEAIISIWQGYVESNHGFRFWRPTH